MVWLGPLSDDLPEWLKDVPPPTELEMALFEIHSALSFEIEELMVYAAFLPDKRVEIENKIEGLRIAQGYLYRKRAQ